VALDILDNMSNGFFEKYLRPEEKNKRRIKWIVVVEEVQQANVLAGTHSLKKSIRKN